MEHTRSFVRLATVAAVFATMTACSNDSTGPAAIASVAAVAASNAQVGIVGQPLASPISVKVLDANGSPVTGALVSWAVQSGGGTISATSSPTDSTGVASVSWTLGTIAGVDSLTATVSGQAPLAFSATASPGAVASLVKVSGDGAALTAGASAVFVVKALDGFGNAVPGVTIAWTPENGGSLSATTSVTGLDGLAQSTLTPDQGATFQVMADVQGDPTIETLFTATES